MSASSLNRYDFIARFYDQLARLVFGDQIFSSQTHFLTSVPDDSNVLILGGGTGLIARELLKIRPRCRITFVDASAKMISIAKANNFSSRVNIVFVHGTENDIPAVYYEVVITNFFLDLFSPKELEVVLQKIKARLTLNAIWLVTDFQKPKTLRQKFVLAFMYRFFALVTRLKNQELPLLFKQIKKIGFNEIETTEFASGFIKTTVLKRTNELSNYPSQPVEPIQLSPPST
jgi:ubiquinone/menaquinone biosynthesis C-methylase UbiE